MDALVIAVIMAIVGAAVREWWVVLVTAITFALIGAILAALLGGVPIVTAILWGVSALVSGSAVYGLRFLPSRKRPRRRPMGLDD